MKAPPGAADRDTAKIDAEVFVMIPDRTHKVKAPEQFVPNGRWPAAGSVLEDEGPDHCVL